MAAAAILHSFYTEIEKIFKMIAQDVDGGLPAAESWHKELLDQMATNSLNRSPVISANLRSRIRPFLAFRHLFRGASIVLMRWEKLSPLVEDAPLILTDFEREIKIFLNRPAL